jgi:hypothetical protein
MDVRLRRLARNLEGEWRRRGNFFIFFARNPMKSLVSQKYALVNASKGGGKGGVRD